MTKNDNTIWIARATVVLAMLAVGAGCGGDDDSGTSETDSGVGPGQEDGGTRVDGGTNVPDEDAGAGEDAGSSDAGSVGEDGGPPYPSLPPVLSVSGCQALAIGPLCSVTQDGDALSANCSGRVLTGTVSESGNVALAADPWTTSEGATAMLACTGRFVLGQLTATCTRTTTAVGETPAGEQTCNLLSDRDVLPGVTCLELPPRLDDVVLCVEGDARGGATITAGTCRVIQDGCAFQAECADDLVLTGTVTRTGISFSQRLEALADAQTPSGGGSPAFMAGDIVAHSCTATLEGTTLSGSCGAGRAGRGGADTSVCAISGAQVAPPTCDLVAPASETLFALHSCDELRNGVGGEPGIGEPVCAFRQNNCIWEVNCGNNPLLTFSGRIAPGDDSVRWHLLTGTPCEIGFDDAGNLEGECTVPGEEACMLRSIDAVPGGETCPAAVNDAEFTSRGCGAAIDCRIAVQHQCAFMALCSFTTRFPDVVIAGRSSYVDGRPHLAFNGLTDWQCYVDQATTDEITSGDRVTGEWYGQCVNPSGGMCRNNYNPATGTGFRGLQVFFESSAE
ncbi:hypothetical protein [Sandaracinus amylolyticus]|uniref:Uncharacterized protein n=1 Tax=Sandaracinus amylolyticus TaxID=927083 RepID=A0A0F6YKZ7_9BACT|nr:hypothetical protein [Sandaracinus amylolyticus]AKF08728.1 hypothetical protein DB32_005877 [Sandaracinus amylolyticus]